MSRNTEDNWGKGYSEETLEQALKRCYGDASKALYSQAEIAVKAVCMLAKPTSILVVEVGPTLVRHATAHWYRLGLSPATINKRLNCLSKMGVSVEGLRVKDPKKLKWYLREDIRVQVLTACDQEAKLKEWPEFSILADLIAWTTRTGLRIEESLRLRWCDFDAEFKQVTVPGTKTSSSQATLPLGHDVSDMLTQIKANLYAGQQGDLVFPITYLKLQNAWDMVRGMFGWKDDPTATLKALRRSAARYLHVDCGMPLHMVQQYLRHESMDTTLEYLRLTGGYGTEEMRRYLR